MHSSRMRTDRSLTVCWSLLVRGGGCLLRQGCPLPRGISLLGGGGASFLGGLLLGESPLGASFRGASLGGSPSGGLLLGASFWGGASFLGGASFPGGLLLGGVLLGGSPSGGLLGQVPPFRGVPPSWGSPS